MRPRRRNPPPTATPHRSLVVHDVAGERLNLSVHIGTDTVELFHQEHRRATFDRRQLSAWLHHPHGDLTVDDVTWAATNGVVILTIRALFVSDVIRPTDLDDLIEHV